MTSKWHRIFQIALGVAQVSAPFWIHDGGMLVSVQGTLAAAQGGLALYAHGQNPDGTPATQPYVPPVKKVEPVTDPKIFDKLDPQ